MKSESKTDFIRLILMSVVLSATMQQCEYPSSTEPSVASTPSHSPVVTSPYVGNVAPDFTVKGVNGETVSLGDLRGKVVLLAFFGTTG